MGADGESLDVSVRIDAGSSLSVEEHREQGSPLSVLNLLGLHQVVANRRHPGCHTAAHLQNRMWVFVQWSIEFATI